MLHTTEAPPAAARLAGIASDALVSLPRHSFEQTKPETWIPIDFADVAQLHLLQLQLQLQLCLHFLNTSTAERVDVWDRMRE